MPRKCDDHLEALSSLRGATLRTLLEEHGEKGVAGCSKRDALQRIADSKKQRQIVAAGLLILAEVEHAQCREDSSTTSEDDSGDDAAESDTEGEGEDSEAPAPAGQQSTTKGKPKRRRG